MKLLQTPDSKILLIALLAVCILWYVEPDSGSKKELKRTIKMYQHQKDSIISLWNIQKDSTQFYAKQVERSQAETRIAERERDRANRQTQIAWRKYEEIKHRNYSAPQLDSIIRVLYPH